MVDLREFVMKTWKRLKYLLTFQFLRVDSIDHDNNEYMYQYLYSSTDDTRYRESIV